MKKLTAGSLLLFTLAACCLVPTSLLHGSDESTTEAREEAFSKSMENCVLVG